MGGGGGGKLTVGVSSHRLVMFKNHQSLCSFSAHCIRIKPHETK